MAVMRWKWAQVRGRRLARHGLAWPFDEGGMARVATALAGVHAQVATSAELAIGLRVTGVTRSAVRAAIWPDRELIRAHGPRGTVHLLAARDFGMWTAALAPAAGVRTGFAPGVQLTASQADEVVAAIGDALVGADLTIDELDAEVVRRAGAWAGERVMPAFQDLWPRWRQALSLAGMRGVLTFGPGRGRKVTYTGPPAAAVPGPAVADAAAWIVGAYLHSYGPSTPERFANWLGGVTAREASSMFASADLEEVSIEGGPAWTEAGDAEPPDRDAAVGCVRLLPYFDGYAYRVGILAPELLYPGTAGTRLFPYAYQTLLVDGVVAGIWHQRRSGTRVTITVEPFGELSAVQREAVAEQAARVAAVQEAKAQLVFGKVTSGPHA
jgi:Winged helix DNA-binding domain